MKFIPLNGKIAVKLAETKTTAGGIFIPDNAITDRISKGTVLAVSGRLLNNGILAKPIVDVGNTVTWVKGNGIPMKDEDGIAFLVLSPDEVIGKFVND